MELSDAFINGAAIFFFLSILVIALLLIYNIYLCDGQTCKPFTIASNTGVRGSREYTISIVNSIYDDGIWPFPYIAAAILTPLSLWFLNVPITIQNFAIMFFTSFAVIYFIFSFLGHHYVRYLTGYVTSYIEEFCPVLPIE